MTEHTLSLEARRLLAVIAWARSVSGTTDARDALGQQLHLSQEEREELDEWVRDMDTIRAEIAAERAS